MKYKEMDALWIKRVFLILLYVCVGYALKSVMLGITVAGLLCVYFIYSSHRVKSQLEAGVTYQDVLRTDKLIMFERVLVDTNVYSAILCMPIILILYAVSIFMY